MISFSKPVEDKKAVERALVLKTSRPVVGAWYWDGDQALWFRPRAYWPQNTKVSFIGHFDGVQLSPGVYSTHTLRQDFKIGRSLIVVASTSSHSMKVYKDRKLIATWPISTGRPGKDTPNGTYLSIEKANPQHMVGDDYDIQVPHSVRFTWSGDFIHAAPWSVGSQGYANVSHGCVNLAPDRAQTYYYWSIPGDPVTVTGSPKAGRWDDGYTVWFLSWKELVKGSALRKAVRVGPDGSTLVRPSDLKKSRAKAPLGRPKPDNAAAS
jgi:lipoprotein-anchoring transpeptidase ErfK/SrfK